MAEPLRGAAAIDDELEVGFDQRFERRWHGSELAGQAIMVLVVAAGLAGLLGEGPFSHRRLHAPGTIAAVDFEPVARFETPTQITLHLPGAGRQDVVLRLSSTFVEPFGLSKIVPAPMVSTAAGHEVLVHVALDGTATEHYVRLAGSPTEAGPLHLWAAVAGEPPVRWTQVVLP